MVLSKISTFLKSLPRLRGRQAAKAYGLLGVGLFLFGGVLALAYNFIFLPGAVLTPGGVATGSGSRATPTEARDIPGPINGLLFTASEAKAWQNRRPLGVILENHVNARPQSGLSSADVVYEAIAEGGITRTLAMYLTNLTPVSLGPVRSMRIYFLDWLEEYQAVAAHVGGNIVAMQRIGAEGVRNIDQFYNGATYDRVSDRPAPHNVYTTTDRLWQTAERKGYTGSSTFPSWKFKQEATASARPASQTLRLGFQGYPSYKVIWNYNPADNTYQRSVGGSPDIDRGNNQPVLAKTIAVAVMDYKTGLSYPGDVAAKITNIGSGMAYVLTDGVVTEGTWSKKTRTDRTIFKDAKGVEISFNRGPIWVEVVPPGTPVEFQ